MSNQRAQLSRLCEQLDNVLALNSCGGFTTGGTVGPQRITLYFQPRHYVRLSSVYQNYAAIAQALRVDGLKIERGELGIEISFDNPQQAGIAIPLFNQVIDAKWEEVRI